MLLFHKALLALLSLPSAVHFPPNQDIDATSIIHLYRDLYTMAERVTFLFVCRDLKPLT